MRLRSLRARLLFGALFWALGLFAAGLIVSTAVMMNHPGLPRRVHDAAWHYAVGVSLFALICLIVGIVQVRRGVSPVSQLRRRLSRVHAGLAERLDGAYPAEVQPLVDDLNALLEHRDRAIRRALAKAGDLAHGLKTPLAVLAHEAARAEADGHRQLAGAIGDQVERMRRQIEYHLAHARAAASGVAAGAHCNVRDSAEPLARTLRRLHADRGVAIEVNVPPEHAVRCGREDLDEMLGNLVDNACKWGRSRVLVSSSADDQDIVITVDDDGPGLDPSKRGEVLRRGVRADEAAPGSGLGLAIVRDLAELYGGSVMLDGSPLGGLRASLRVPSTAPALGSGLASGETRKSKT
jgi:signal transduction histidine kinase